MIFHWIGANLVLFADDTNLLITEKDEWALQHKIINMKELETWFPKNNLVINTGKTIPMPFTLNGLDFLQDRK
jgi:hypothetical protein